MQEVGFCGIGPCLLSYLQEPNAVLIHVYGLRGDRPLCNGYIVGAILLLHFEAYYSQYMQSTH